MNNFFILLFLNLFKNHEIIDKFKHLSYYFNFLPSILVSFSAMISQSDMMNIFEIGNFLLLGQNSTIVFLQHQNKK